MVAIYKTNAKPTLQGKYLTLQPDSTDYEVNGIGRYQKKIAFISGALPGEQVQVQVTEDKADFIKAVTVKVLQASTDRIPAACRHFSRCGGCQLQYLTPSRQQQLKQQGVDELIRHQTGLAQLPWQLVLTATAAGYRRKARIGLWFDKKRATLSVGFRQNQSKQITDISECLVLSPVLMPVFQVLKQVVAVLKKPEHITHAEVIDADGQAYVIIRHVDTLSTEEKQRFIDAWPQAVWLGEPQSGVYQYWQQTAEILSYRLTSQQLDIQFRPSDFIQVNAAVNQQMIDQAIAWLAPTPQDTVLDLYCGVGNFSLALAQVAAKVYGIEGVDAMVQQAALNARNNGLTNIEFQQADLHLPWPVADWNSKACRKVLLDPARAGAQGAVEQLLRLKPQDILYVSCNPATFARDARIILQSGYQLQKISGIDMFPHTSHLELMALFTRTVT